MVEFNTLKTMLEKNGELMLCLDNGEKIELHKHNVTFDETTKEIKVDAGNETIWIPTEKIAYYKIHKEGFEK